MPRRPRAAALRVDPSIGDVLFLDTQGLAGDYQEVLEALAPYETSTIKAIVFKKPVGPGPYAILRSYPAPIDMDVISEMVKAEYGGGDYRVTLFAGGKTRKQIDFSIIGEPKIPGQKNVAGMAGGGDGDALKLFMAMQEAADRRREDDMRERREMARESNDLLKTAIVAAIPVALPFLLGANREKLSDVLALVSAGRPKETSMKELFETMALAKGLFKEEGAGFDPEDMAGSLMRLAGPALGAVGRAARGMQGGGEPPAAAPVMLPAPIYAPPPTTPAAVGLNPIEAATGAPGARLLGLIGPHVMYFFSAALPADLAAEAIVTIMLRENVTEEEVFGLVAAFTSSADWQADLAAQGFDLRSNPDWGDELLESLTDEWTNRHGRSDGGAGGGWRMENPEDHAEPGPEGLALNGDSGPGGPARH